MKTLPKPSPANKPAYSHWTNNNEMMNPKERKRKRRTARANMYMSCEAGFLLCQIQLSVEPAALRANDETFARHRNGCQDNIHGKRVVNLRHDDGQTEGVLCR
jgi:hypothetical protein